MLLSTSDVITGVDIIKKASFDMMNANENSYYFGLGINDPKRIFGTTDGLLEQFGPERVFETPTSENAMTGIGVGLALAGNSVIMCHQRLDFFLLAFDQVVNVAAKWNYTYGADSTIPIIIRLIVGRGWGQGPTHSQSLHSIFAHIPGLKVFMPSMPQFTYSLFETAFKDPNPVIWIEHRWLHNLNVEENKQIKVPEDGVVKLNEGENITVVSISSQTPVVQKVAKALKKHNIGLDHFSILKIRPLVLAKIISSIKKTGHLMVVDTGHVEYGFGSEVISQCVQACGDAMRSKPVNVGKPSFPEPTSFFLTKDYHISSINIVEWIEEQLGQKILNSKSILEELKQDGTHDVPGDWFKGPF